MRTGAAARLHFGVVSSGATSVQRMARRRRSTPHRGAQSRPRGRPARPVRDRSPPSSSRGRRPGCQREPRSRGSTSAGSTSPLRRATLERRSAALGRKPVEFVAGGRTFALTASQLGVRPDWAAAVRSAAAAGDGFAPVRGLKRVQTRIFGTDVAPHVGRLPVGRSVHGRADRRRGRPARRRCESPAAGAVGRRRPRTVREDPRPRPRHDDDRHGARLAGARQARCACPSSVPGRR